MSTSLESTTVLLSKQLGDYWASTTTGGGSSIHLVDSALKAKAADWITDETYVIVREGTYDGIERKVSLLSDETLTVQAYADTVGSGIDYELHRLFTPSEKRRALIDAAKSCFPHLFAEVRDESKVSGNWLKDGSFEIWTSTSALTYWTKSASTLVQTSTAGVFEHGAYSCKIYSGAGYIKQSVADWDDLKRLAGKTVTFAVRGWCDTASCLRISINDGIADESFSSWHDGDSSWTRDNDPLTVTQTIDDNPTEVTFKIYHALEAASEISYVDDARVISGGRSQRIYIGDLGLAQNKPHQVLIEPSNYSNQEPWLLIHGITYDQTNGYMYLPDYVSNDYRLRILGIKYLDFYDTSDVVGTDWEDTIAIDSPKTEILVAQAAIYLCNQMVVPNDTSGTSETWIRALGYWQRELTVRKAKFGMIAPSATISWG